LSIARSYSSYSALPSGLAAGFFDKDQGFGIGWSAPFFKRLVIMVDGSGVLAYRSAAVFVPFIPNGSGFTPHVTSDLQLVASGSGYVLTQPNGATEHYDPTGRLLSETTANGLITSYGYNANGQVSTVTGPYGHTLTFTYTADGSHIETIMDPNGRIVRYTYNNNNLVQVNYPDLTGLIYYYENPSYRHHLTGIADLQADGTIIRFATFGYDSSRRAQSTEHAVTTNTTPQEKFTFFYSAYTDVTDAANNKERLSFITQNNTKLLTQRTNLVDNKTLTQTFDPATNDLTCKKDDEGRVVQYLYNTTHQRISHTTGLTGTCTTPVTTAATRTTTYQYLTPTLDLPTLIESPSVAGGTLKKQTVLGYTDPRFPTLPTTITQAGYTPTGSAVYRVVGITYTPHGQVETINGPRAPSDPGMAGVDDITTFTYYDCTTGGACGQLKSVTDALGHTTTYSNYTPDGRVQTVTDPNGKVTTYGYDARGRIAYVLNNGAGTINYRTYTYTPWGDVKTLTVYPGNLIYTYGYDDAHDLRSLTDSAGNTVTYLYDAKGNRTATFSTNPDGSQAQSLTAAYDTRNHIQSLNHGGNLTQQVYDAVGNLTNETDPNHSAAGSAAATMRTYDYVNRLKTQTDHEGWPYLTYEYDINDHVTKVFGPSATGLNSFTTTYTYDDLGNLLQETSPDRGTTTYTDDTAGNVLTVTDARNVVMTTTYDALNRPVRVDYPGTNDDITYTYDTAPGCTNGIGHRCTSTTASVTTTYAYHPLGDLTDTTTTVSGHAYTVHTERDGFGRVTALTYPDGRQVTYLRDPRGRITNVTATVNGVATTLVSQRQFRADDQLQSQTFGNGLLDTRLYTPAGRLVNQFLGAADTRVYGYDYNGNLTSLQTLPVVASYTYDGRLNQLLTDNDGSLLSFTYQYVTTGDRTTGAGHTYTYTPNSHRLATIDGLPVTVSPDGRLLTDPVSGRTYSYSNAGDLASVTQAGSLLGYYGYDPEHRRRTKTTATGTTVYHYDDDGHLLQETNSAGTAIRTYLWADGLPIAQIHRLGTTDTVVYLHTDHEDTPRLATDASGKVIWRWDGNAFGDDYPNEDPGNTGTKTVVNLRFAGQYYDRETGLHYNWHRYYDPRLGRYITSDPIGLRGGLNTYAYVGNNPLRYIDPLGLWTGQIGFNVTAKIWGPLAFSITGGIAFDGHGNFAGYGEYGGGITTSPDVSGGLALHGSNGDTINDLNGLFTNVSAGGGWGPHASGDAFFGFGANGQRVEGGGLTIGLGAGGSSSTTITNTSIGNNSNAPEALTCP
jgi:RHS repeat-associated protein